MSSSMKAAIRLGTNFFGEFVCQTTKFEEIESLFNITRKLIMVHSEEMLNVNCLECASRSWARSVLSHDQAIRWTKAKVRVYADIPFYVLDR